MVRRATAQAAGSQAQVLPVETSSKVPSTASVPSTAPIGITPPPIALPRHIRSGWRSQSSAANSRPVRPKPVLTSSRQSSQPCSSQSSRQCGPEACRRDDDPAGAEHRLDHHACHLGRVDGVEEQLVPDEVDGAVARTSRTRLGERTPVRAWVRRVHEPTAEAPDALADLVVLGAQAGRGRGLPVVAAVEAEDQRASRRPAHEPHGGLDGLGAVQRQVNPRQAGRSDVDQPAGELRHQRVGDGVAVLVAERQQLLGGGLDEVGTTGTERHGGRGADEVDEDVAVEVLHEPAVLAGGHERVGAVGLAGVEDGTLGLELLLGTRTGQRPVDARCLVGRDREGLSWRPSSPVIADGCRPRAPPGPGCSAARWAGPRRRPGSRRRRSRSTTRTGPAAC